MLVTFVWVKWGVSIACLPIFLWVQNDTLSHLLLFTTEIPLQYGTAADVPTIPTCNAPNVLVDVGPTGNAPFDIQVLYPRKRPVPLG